MSKWTDLPTELLGVAKAVQNLKGQPQEIARYVVERIGTYIGADHESIARAMIAKALIEITGSKP